MTRADGSPGGAGDPRADLRAVSLVRLRWGAAAGEAFSLLVARYSFEANLPLGPVLGLVGLLAASNLLLALGIRRRALPAPAIAAVLAFDVLQLTALLAWVGGSSNPFSVLYLVQISMAALMLGPRWTWALAAFAVTAYGALFALVPVPLVHDHTGEGFASHLRVMWIAFTAAAGLIAYFAVRLASALERRESELREVREHALRQERLAALTTLAAGAAHELGTPLASVAVAARELERALEQAPGPGVPPMREDVRLIRQELDRCRRILDGMAADAGEMVGEVPRPIPVPRLLDEVRRGLRPDELERIEFVPGGDAGLVVFGPLRALAGAVVNLLRNAVEASPPEFSVKLSAARAKGGRVRLTVEDWGEGMAPEVLARARDPFFTTKPPGRGLGLGLFLVQTLADRLGGHLDLDTTPGAGTRARLDLPGPTAGTADAGT